MKLFLSTVVLVLVGVCSCEPPRFRSSRLRSRVLSRQEVAPADPAAPADPSALAAPYPASGWKPDGETLELPTEQAPVAEYGPPNEASAPSNEYGPPTNEYGPAAADPEALPEEEPEAETVAVDKNGRLISSRYVVLPSSAFRRAQFAPQFQRAPAKLRRTRF